MRALAFLLIFAAAESCFSQGTVNFANYVPGDPVPIVDAPVSYNDGVSSFLVAGAAYAAQLYIGPAGSPVSLLTTNGVTGGPVTSFLTGAQAGYFAGGVRTLFGWGPGTTISAQVRVWATDSGESWERSSFRGQSYVIQITLGGPPAPAPNLVGLTGAPFPPSGFGGLYFASVPEPSVYALAILGLLAASFLSARRRTS